MQNVCCDLQELGNEAEERRLLDDGLKKFPYFDKLWLMLGQLEERRGAAEAARHAYQEGIKRSMHSVPLWRSAARLEEKVRCCFSITHNA